MKRFRAWLHRPRWEWRVTADGFDLTRTHESFVGWRWARRRRRELCKRCGWHASGRDEAKVRVRALRHVEGCGLCESHGKRCGEPHPIEACTHQLCVKVRDAEMVVAWANHRANERRKAS